MSRIEIYTKFMCPFCARAKALLDVKGASYEETDITTDAGKRQEMLGRANGRTTVPQIFIAGAHIGGCDDLMALEAKGALDPLLAA
jgi:glutaredoxin 3